MTLKQTLAQIRYMNRKTAYYVKPKSRWCIIAASNTAELVRTMSRNPGMNKAGVACDDIRQDEEKNGK